MIKQINPFHYKSLLILIICLISSSSAFAFSNENQLLVTQNLSRKLQSDLASDNVTVKLNNVKEYKISKSEIGLKGDATCILADSAEQLPIQFELKVDAVKQTVSDIRYDFIEKSSAYAPSSTEEVLMKEIMTKISSDYKTRNIVIAIDTFENVGNAANEKKFLGVGEVRIGDMVWNKIKFDVSLDSQTQKASKVIYKVEK